MAAVKMVNGFMVKQLLKKDSELISTTDNEGRTAVHWAAMVDNVEALRMLVSRGPDTIKDAQDHKVQRETLHSLRHRLYHGFFS